jgi:hypothetical protein
VAIRFRFRLATLLGFVTISCLVLGVSVAVVRRVLTQRQFVAYLDSEYHNLPWAGVRYDHEGELSDLHSRPLTVDLLHSVVEVYFYTVMKPTDEEAKNASRVQSLEIISFDDRYCDITDTGVRRCPI